MMRKFEDQEVDNQRVPDGLLALLEDAVTNNPRTETAGNNLSPLTLNPTQVGTTTVEPMQISTIAERLLSDIGIARVTARDEMAELISQCADVACATAIFDLLPDGPSLTNSSCRGITWHRDRNLAADGNPVLGGIRA